VAVVFMVLFIAGLVPVTLLVGPTHFPAPTASTADIVAYFRSEPAKVRLCGFLQFASAIPLGIFTASMVSRLRFLGVEAAGPTIALFGGLAASTAVAVAALGVWTLGQPGVADDAGALLAVYFAGFGLGGPGFSVPLGLLIAGISVPSLFLKLLPRWLCVFGLMLAVVGELSTLSLMFPAAIPLIPLTRFPGFIWLILAGFGLPNRRPNRD
jgi:hypothetical protein